MKKIIYRSLMACLALGLMTACESHDYEDVSKPHQYGENENPPIKGTDANMAVAYAALQQGSSDVATIRLSDYADEIQKQMGMSLDECISGLQNGSVRFLMANPVRRVWDKTPGNASDNSWYLNSFGTIADLSNSVAQYTFDAASKTIKINVTENATGGVVQMMAGFVKTDNSAYPVHFRLLVALTITDASVVQASLKIPANGDYTYVDLAFADYAFNIAYAFDGMTLAEFAAALDPSNGVFDAFMMSADGSLTGGPGKYTANGLGYWLTQDCKIVNWGADGFAFFLEPDFWDWDNDAPATDGGVLSIGRLSNSTPASGTTIEANYVLRSTKNTSKSLTLMLTLYFE